jgi:hypothetical protein
MKSPAPKLDVTPALARQVIELYATELSDVRFPDLDLSDLLQHQAELHTAQLEVERIEAELAQAREEVETRSQALSLKAERALSYARVFAQGNPELSPRIADIGRRKGALGHSPHAPNPDTGLAATPPKRGRRPKASAPSELFSEAAAPAE